MVVLCLSALSSRMYLVSVNAAPAVPETGLEQLQRAPSSRQMDPEFSQPQLTLGRPGVLALEASRACREGGDNGDASPNAWRCLNSLWGGGITKGVGWLRTKSSRRQRSNQRSKCSMEHDKSPRLFSSWLRKAAWRRPF